jgi:hypothetical protein
MINKIQTAIDEASNHRSHLIDPIHKLDSMASAKVRHLLNNLTGCLNEVNYLEVGTYRGASLVSAMYGRENVSKAYVIDNWIWPKTHQQQTRKAFHKNVKTFIPSIDLTLIEEDCTTVDLDLLKHKMNYVFYDADHQYEGQYASLVHLAPVFANVFILVVDDWAQLSVRRGVQDALRDTHIKVNQQWVLPGAPDGEGDKKLWWHGLFVALATKIKIF